MPRSVLPAEPSYSSVPPLKIRLVEAFEAAPALVAAGAAVLVPDDECDADRLEREAGPILADVSRRSAMADAARSIGRPDAARRAGFPDRRLQTPRPPIPR